MTDSVRIALIHATRVAIEPIESAAKNLWPELETFSVMDEALSKDKAANRVPISELNERIVQLARYAEQMQPAGILYTCSAFGEGIEAAAKSSRLPVLKPNEAMFEEAMAQGRRIAMIYTFAAAAQSMHAEFNQIAERTGSGATLVPILAEGAREKLDSGNIEAHNNIVAYTAASLDNFDVVLLAHFSTAQAATAVGAAVELPVLTSPESALRKMRRLVEQG